MHNFNLKVNDRTEVIVDEKAYKALVMDLQEDFIKINVPVFEGDYLMLHSGEKIEMNSYLDENRCYNFQCNIISRGKEGNIIYYRLSKPYEIKKIQRRNFFRISVVNPIEYKKINNAQEEDFDSVPYEKALMVDISGGGLKIKVKEDIKKDDLLLVNLMLNRIQAEIKCDIVRIEDTIERDKICGLRFLDITPAQSEKLIQELFEIARKQRATT